MSRLDIFAADRPDAPLSTHHDATAIHTQLANVGVRFERCEVVPGLAPGTDPAVVATAYAARIEAVRAGGGYARFDVVSIAPDDPERERKRGLFLPEHTHREDEVRLFAAGRGLFSLHLGDRVYQVLCEAGDLISVPDGTPHWFDMGPAPAFVAIRWFTDPAGWVANPTGWADAARFPRLTA